MDISLWEREWDSALMAPPDDFCENSTTWGWDCADLIGDDALGLHRDLQDDPRPPQVPPAPSQQHQLPAQRESKPPQQRQQQLQQQLQPQQHQHSHQAQLQSYPDRQPQPSLTESQALHARHTRELSEAYTLNNNLVESYFDESPASGTPRRPQPLRRHSRGLEPIPAQMPAQPQLRRISAAQIPATPIRRSSSSASSLARAVGLSPAQVQAQAQRARSRTGSVVSPDSQHPQNAAAQDGMIPVSAVVSSSAPFFSGQPGPGTASLATAASSGTPAGSTTANSVNNSAPNTSAPTPSAGAGSPAKPSTRRRISKEQTEILEKAFELDPRPSREDRVQLVEATGLQPRSVQIWFQNRRAKMRLQMQQGANGSTVTDVTELYRSREIVHTANLAAAAAAADLRRSPVRYQSAASPGMMATPVTPVQQRRMSNYPVAFTANSAAGAGAAQGVPPHMGLQPGMGHGSGGHWGSPAGGERWYGLPNSASSSSLAANPPGGYDYWPGQHSGLQDSDSPLLYSPAPTTPMSAAAVPIGDYDPSEYSPYARELVSHQVLSQVIASGSSSSALAAAAAGNSAGSGSQNGSSHFANIRPMHGGAQASQQIPQHHGYIGGDLQGAPNLLHSPRLYSRASSPEYPFPPYEHLGRSKSAVFVRNVAAPTLTDQGAVIKRRKSSLKSIRSLRQGPMRSSTDLSMLQQQQQQQQQHQQYQQHQQVHQQQQHQQVQHQQMQQMQIQLQQQAKAQQPQQLGSPAPPSRAASRESFHSASRGRSRSHTSGSITGLGPGQNPGSGPVPIAPAVGPASTGQGSSGHSPAWSSGPTLAGAAAQQSQQQQQQQQQLGGQPFGFSNSGPGTPASTSGQLERAASGGGMRLQLGEHNNVATLVMVPSAYSAAGGGVSKGAQTASSTSPASQPNQGLPGPTGQMGQMGPSKSHIMSQSAQVNPPLPGEIPGDWGVPPPGTPLSRRSSYGEPRPISPMHRGSLHGTPTPLLSVGEEDDEKNVYWPMPQRFDMLPEE